MKMNRERPNWTWLTQNEMTQVELKQASLLTHIRSGYNYLAVNIEH